jgi:hypothetical protein
MTRDLIPTESDIRLNQSPPSEEWAKIRALGENKVLDNGIELIFNEEDIFDYLEVEKC